MKVDKRFDGADKDGGKVQVGLVLKDGQQKNVKSECCLTICHVYYLLDHLFTRMEDPTDLGKTSYMEWT